MINCMAKKRDTTDRHKPRRTISFPVDLYDALSRLAEINERPLQWQVHLILKKVLVEEGLWPKDPKDN